MNAKRSRVALLAAVLMLASACAQSERPSIYMRHAKEPTKKGNSLTLGVKTRGIEIRPADGDTSGRTGHFHVFIDSEPVPVGEVIPQEPGIVHAPKAPIKLYGLSKGEHHFTVVLGDGAHRRIATDSVVEATVEFLGPFVDATAPSSIGRGEDLRIEMEADGVEIVEPDGDTSGRTGHFHVFVDPAKTPMEALKVPGGQGVIRTTDSSVTISDLVRGEHTIYIAIGDGTHRLWDPAVMDVLTVSVE